jgi:hypothetical protein
LQTPIFYSDFKGGKNMAVLDYTLSSMLSNAVTTLEKELGGDVIAYIGGMSIGYAKHFREAIEKLNPDFDPKNGRILHILLVTSGGSAEAVELMVNITRQHYETVNFIIPSQAQSAGTIFAMSGDNIFMDYTSYLGPIDPQVPTATGKYVPALGYLDQVEKLIEKAKKDELTNAEFALLQNLDLAELRRYEQARDLSISLLKEWLVKYKFKNWNVHRTTNPGTPVTQDEKEARANEIASSLADNKKWHAHTRPISIEKLKELRLEIEDYTNNKELREKIRMYTELLFDYSRHTGLEFMLHTRSIA